MQQFLKKLRRQQAGRVFGTPLLIFGLLVSVSYGADPISAGEAGRSFTWDEETLLGQHRFFGEANNCCGFWVFGANLAGHRGDGAKYNLFGTVATNEHVDTVAQVARLIVRIPMAGIGEAPAPGGKHFGEFEDTVLIDVHIDIAGNAVVGTALSVGGGKEEWQHPLPPAETGALSGGSFVSVWPAVSFMEPVYTHQCAIDRTEFEDCINKANEKGYSLIDNCFGEFGGGCSHLGLSDCLIKVNQGIIDGVPIECVFAKGNCALEEGRSRRTQSDIANCILNAHAESLMALRACFKFVPCPGYHPQQISEE